MKRATCVDHRDEHVIGIERRPTSAVVADHHPEVHITIGGREGFADGGRSSEQVGIAGKDPLRTGGGIPGTEQRTCTVITIVNTLLCAQIALLPGVRQRVACVGIGTSRGEYKRGGCRNRVIGTGIHRRYAVSCVGDRRCRICVSAGDFGNHLVEAHRVEVRVAVGLQIVTAHDARIAHDRRCATRFHRSTGIAIAVVAVESVVSAELMAQFVGHIINVERVTDRRSLTGHAASLGAGITDHAESRHAPTAGAEYMPDIIIGIADHTVYIRLIFAQHRKTVVIAIGIGRTVGIDELVIVGDKNHAGRDVGLIDAIDPIHGRHNRRHGSFHSAPMVGGILSGTRDRQVIGPQLRSVGKEGPYSIVAECPLIGSRFSAAISVIVYRNSDCTVRAAAAAGMISARFVILRDIDADIV